jgi:hypothetical protein
MFKDLDVVALTVDVPTLGLREGDVGTIVDVHRDGKAFEVEFVASNGRTIALETFDIAQIRAMNSGESLLGRVVVA